MIFKLTKINLLKLGKGVKNVIHTLPIAKIAIVLLIIVFGISAYDSVFKRKDIKSLRGTIHNIKSVNTKQLRDSEQHLRNITSLNNELGQQKQKLDAALGAKSNLENSNRELSKEFRNLRTEFDTAKQRNTKLGTELQSAQQQLSDLNSKYGNLTDQINRAGNSVDDLGNLVESVQRQSGQNERDSGAIDGGIEKLVSGWKNAGGIVGQIRSTIEQYCTCEYPNNNN